MSGLHVLANLQYLTKAENSRKNNKVNLGGFMNRLAIILLVLLLLTSLKALGGELQDVISQLKRHSAPDAVPARELAPVIVSLAHFYKIEPKTLTSIVLQESKGREQAYNAKTFDHGLGQLNRRTAKQYGLNHTCLYNWRCNITVTAKLLSLTKGELCRYNVGRYRIIEGRWVQRCAAYNARVAKND